MGCGMKVNELMSTHVISVSQDTSIHDVARLMAERDIGVLLVYDEKHVVGIVTDRDIVTRFVSRDDVAINCAVRDILTADVVCCHDRQDMRKAAEIMGDHQVRRLPVLDDNDHLVGIVTLGDIARDGSEHLAGEALGEIVEER